MKVLMINTVSGIKSTGRICTDMADLLFEHGHDCRIIYGRGNVPKNYEHISKTFNSNIEIHFNALLARIFDNEGFNAKKSTKKLIEFIKEYDPDIIQLYNLHGYYINIQMLFEYLIKSNKPVVYTLHDCWPVTGHCAHFVDISCEKWKTGCKGKCLKRKNYPKSLFFSRAYTNWKLKRDLLTGISKLTIVVVSEWLSGIIESSFLKGKKIFVIPNGIDLDKFKPIQSDFKKRHGIENKKMVLGVATAWGSLKGLQEMIELQNVLGDEYQVVLVGLTEKQKMTLPSNIIGLMRTDSVTELAEIYSAADVYVNASKQETMGLTSVESMACGTPAVVSSLTAIPEVIDANSGVVYQPYGVIEMAEKVKEVLAETYDNTRSRALLYDKRKQYMKYINLYENLCAKDRN